MPELNFKVKVQPKMIKRDKVIVGEVIQSPFWKDIELGKRNIVSDEASLIEVYKGFYKRDCFIQLSKNLIDTIIRDNNSINIINLILYIASNIKFNSNKIILNGNTDEMIKMFGKNHLSRYIDILEDKNIIKRTDKQSVYVVNHNMIFKGNYFDFIKTYKQIYGDIGTNIDIKGRVKLFDDIDYNK